MEASERPVRTERWALRCPLGGGERIREQTVFVQVHREGRVRIRHGPKGRSKPLAAKGQHGPLGNSSPSYDVRLVICWTRANAENLIAMGIDGRASFQSAAANRR